MKVSREQVEELLESPILKLWLQSLERLATELELTVQDQVLRLGYLSPAQQVRLADFRGQAAMAREISRLDFDRFEAILKGDAE